MEFNGNRSDRLNFDVVAEKMSGARDPVRPAGPAHHLVLWRRAIGIHQQCGVKFVSYEAIVGAASPASAQPAPARTPAFNSGGVRSTFEVRKHPVVQLEEPQVRGRGATSLKGVKSASCPASCRLRCNAAAINYMEGKSTGV